MFKLSFFFYFMQRGCSVSVAFLIAAVISIIWTTWACHTLECCSLNFTIIPRSSCRLAISNINMCSRHLLTSSLRAPDVSPGHVKFSVFWLQFSDFWLCLGQYLESLFVPEFLPNTASFPPFLSGAMVCS